MKISKEYLDKNFKYRLTDRSGTIYYEFVSKYPYHLYFNKNVVIEDAPYLLIDTQEKLEKFMSLINPKWKL